MVAEVIIVSERRDAGDADDDDILVAVRKRSRNWYCLLLRLDRGLFLGGGGLLLGGGLLGFRLGGALLSGLGRLLLLGRVLLGLGHGRLLGRLGLGRDLGLRSLGKEAVNNNNNKIFTTLLLAHPSRFAT